MNPSSSQQEKRELRDACFAIVLSLVIGLQITPHTAGIAVVLTSVSSALVNLPLIYQQTKHKDLTRTLTIISVVVVLLGLAVMVLLQKFTR